MGKVVPPDSDQELRELENRERKIRDKWLSFKKKLRANKSPDPDSADERYREEEARFDAAMKLIDDQRETIALNSASRLKGGG